jgi:hypothetical protein
MVDAVNHVPIFTKSQKWRKTAKNQLILAAPVRGRKQTHPLQLRLQTHRPPSVALDAAA